MAQELDMPLSLHVGTYRWQPGIHLRVAPITDQARYAWQQTDTDAKQGEVTLRSIFNLCDFSCL